MGFHAEAQQDVEKPRNREKQRDSETGRQGVDREIDLCDSASTDNEGGGVIFERWNGMTY